MSKLFNGFLKLIEAAAPPLTTDDSLRLDLATYGFCISTIDGDGNQTRITPADYLEEPNITAAALAASLQEKSHG